MSCTARNTGDYRRIVLLVGAAALLLQMFVWAVQAPASAAVSLTPVCTADGVILVNADPDGKPGDPAKSAAKTAGCPLCPLAHGLSVPPPAFVPAAPSILIIHGSLGLPGEYIAAGWYLSSLQARAPPALI